MAAWGKTPDAQVALIGQLLADDVEMRSLAREFTVLGMKEIINQMKRGDPATRAAIAKSLSGVVTKAITEAGDDDGQSELRREMHDMMAEMRGEILGRDDYGETLEADAPKVKKLTPKKR